MSVKSDPDNNILVAGTFPYLEKACGYLQY